MNPSDDSPPSMNPMHPSGDSPSTYASYESLCRQRAAFLDDFVAFAKPRSLETMGRCAAAFGKPQARLAPLMEKLNHAIFNPWKIHLLGFLRNGQVIPHDSPCKRIIREHGVHAALRSLHTNASVAQGLFPL